jgi:hypothetical protein
MPSRTCTGSRTLRARATGRRSRCQLRRLLVPLLLAFSLVGTTGAGAQTFQDDLDFRDTLRDARSGTSIVPSLRPNPTGSLTGGVKQFHGPYGATFVEKTGEPPKDFSFTLTSPLQYWDKSNPRGFASAWQYTPDAILAWSRQPQGWPVQLSASADVSSDRYIVLSGAPAASDTITGVVRLDYVGEQPSRQAFTPFVFYTPRWGLTPFLANWTGFSQDFNTGITKLWDFKSDFTRIPPSSNASFAWEFGAKLNLQHRWVYGSPDSNAVIFVPSMKYAAPGDTPLHGMALGVQLTVAGRWYDPTASGVAQADWLVQPVAVLSYQFTRTLFGVPAAVLGNPKFDLSASYGSLTSNVASAPYQKLAVGPALTLKWLF